MPHPLETVIRESYAAFGRGDVDGVLRAWAQGFSFHIPGRGAIAGHYAGEAGIRELTRKVFGVTGGTFREDVEDVLANDQHAVVLARHDFTREGQHKEYRTARVVHWRCVSRPRCARASSEVTSTFQRWREAARTAGASTAGSVQKSA